MSEIFFKILKKIREESPYTQQQIADFLGISIKQYQNYESKTVPPHDKILKLNEIFKTDLSILIYQKKVPDETVANEDDEPYGKTVTELLGLLKMEKESMKICQQTILSQQGTIQTLAEIIKPPDLGAAKNG